MLNTIGSKLENIKNTITVLTEHFGTKISCGTQDRDRHAQKIKNSIGISVSPEAIVYPRSTAEAQRVISICQNKETPVICFPQGDFSIKPTSEPWRCICLDLTRLKQILSIDSETQTATVEYAVTIQALNQAVIDYRLHYKSELKPDTYLGFIAKQTLRKLENNENDNSSVISIVKLKNNGDIEDFFVTNTVTNSELNFITEVTVKLDTLS